MHLMKMNTNTGTIELHKETLQMNRESLHDLHKILMSAETKDETEEKSVEDV